MKTLITIMISFLFGTLLGNAPIRHSCRTSYLLGWNDAIKYYTNRSNRLKGDEDE